MAEFGYLIIILFFMLTHAFFAGIETGIISIHRMRLRHFVRKGETGSKLLHEFLEDSDRLLGTTLVGTNVSVVIISVVVTSIAMAFFPHWGEALSVALVSLTVLVFGEYIPKTWFRHRPLERSRRFVGTLRFSEIILMPFSKTVVLLTRLLVPGPKDTFSHKEPFVTVEDLKMLAQEGEKDGVLSRKERVMINRVFELSDKSAEEIMVPADDMVTVESDSTIDEFLDVARKSNYTRVPVWDPEEGKYIGILNVFYILSLGPVNHNEPVKKYARPPLFIDQDVPVDEIFPILRRSRQPLALVKDDQNKVIGLLTTEDILEEIVGKL